MDLRRTLPKKFGAFHYRSTLASVRRGGTGGFSGTYRPTHATAACAVELRAGPGFVGRKASLWMEGTGAGGADCSAAAGWAAAAEAEAGSVVRLDPGPGCVCGGGRAISWSAE